MFLLVGLGNPGERYAQTRHNAGFLVVEKLARANGVRSFARLEQKARVARIRLEDREVILAKPQTYMNASGSAVAGLVRYHRIPLTDILVVADDLDLPLGALRIKRSGGSGGHHGLDSIIAALGTKDFARLRLGLGRPSGDTVDFVLGAMDAEDDRKFTAAVNRAVEALGVFVREGPEAAMNKYNRAPGED